MYDDPRYNEYCVILECKCKVRATKNMYVKLNLGDTNNYFKFSIQYYSPTSYNNILYIASCYNSESTSETGYKFNDDTNYAKIGFAYGTVHPEEINLYNLLNLLRTTDKSNIDIQSTLSSNEVEYLRFWIQYLPINNYFN